LRNDRNVISASRVFKVAWRENGLRLSSVADYRAGCRTRVCRRRFTPRQALLAGTLIDVGGVVLLEAMGHTEKANANGAQAMTSRALGVLDWFFNSGEQGAYAPPQNQEWGPVWVVLQD
jgi:hypothetical protein